MLHEIIRLPVQYREAGIENNGFTPRLTTYILSNSIEINSSRKRPLVLICPGGAYRFTSFRESEPIALRMNSLGFHACVLEYSCAPMDFPAAFLDLCEAVKYVRNHTETWSVDVNKVIVCGFSAGAHLAASLGVWWNTAFPRKYLPYTASEIRPDGLLLGYPVITSGVFCHEESIRNVLGPKHNTDEWRNFVSLEKSVNGDVPPVFIWHTAEDEPVPVQNSLLFVESLARHHISFEYHVFARGGHGLSLATEETAEEPAHVQKPCSIWPDMFASWVSSVMYGIVSLQGFPVR